MFEDYLRDLRETPMSFAYNASKLLRLIRQNEFNVMSFVFTDGLGTELSHKGNIVKLSAVKEMVEGQLETYNRTLKSKAFFDHPIPDEMELDIDIEALVYNTQSRSHGYTFSRSSIAAVMTFTFSLHFP